MIKTFSASAHIGALVGFFLMAGAGANTGIEAPTYGALAQTVATAGSLIAAAAALTLCWKGRFKWEPDEQDVPNSAQRFGGLFISVIIGIMWFRFSIQKRLDSDDLIKISLAMSFVSFISLLIYGLLVGVYVYTKDYVIARNRVARANIIGGFWLRKEARHIMQFGDPRPTTVQELYLGSGYNADKVWPRLARALAKMCFLSAYITLVASGTGALAAISLLIASAV